MIYMLIERELYEPDHILGFFNSYEKALDAAEEYDKYLAEVCGIDFNNYGFWTEIRTYEVNKFQWR